MVPTGGDGPDGAVGLPELVAGAGQQLGERGAAGQHVMCVGEDRNEIWRTVVN